MSNVLTTWRILLIALLILALLFFALVPLTRGSNQPWMDLSTSVKQMEGTLRGLQKRLEVLEERTSSRGESQDLTFPSIPSGVVTLETVRSLLKAPEWKAMEAFSDSFLVKNKAIYDQYGARWVKDPFHWWSRVYEYPFIWNGILKAGKEKLGSSKLRLGDMGSGVTFFPFWIAKNLPSATVVAMDYDKSYPPLFDTMLKTMGTPGVVYQEIDLRALHSQPSESFDILYCVSVLEHTDDYTSIVKEIQRMLAPGGLFVLTFDVSLDGKRSIPVPQATALLQLLRQTMSSEVSPWRGSDYSKDVPSDVFTVTVAKNAGIGNAFHWMEPEEKLTFSGHIFKK